MPIFISRFHILFLRRSAREARAAAEAEMRAAKRIFCALMPRGDRVRARDAMPMLPILMRERHALCHATMRHQKDAAAVTPLCCACVIMLPDYRCCLMLLEMLRFRGCYARLR